MNEELQVVYGPSRKADGVPEKELPEVEQAIRRVERNVEYVRLQLSALAARLRPVLTEPKETSSIDVGISPPKPGPDDWESVATRLNMAGQSLSGIGDDIFILINRLQV